MTHTLQVTDGPTLLERLARLVGRRAAAACKTASDAVPCFSFAGTLYHSSSGYLLLSVPNALVRGAFAALDVPGVELPPAGPSGQLEAHITVMHPEDLERIGGFAKVTERGKQFHYALGRLKEVVPDGWAGVSKVFYLTAHSPELQLLRRSYGLHGLPKDGAHEFHVTVGVVRRGVLGRGATSKA